MNRDVLAQQPMPRHKRILRRMGIQFRLVILSWAVTVITLAVFSFSIIPEQKKSLLASLDSKARVMTTSIADVAAGAIVVEDYSSVVDHCMKIIDDGKAIPYIVITRNDGFSIDHQAEGWSTTERTVKWTPAGRRMSTGKIAKSEFSEEQVYHFSTPFDYSGVEWGWIHVGLSLDQFNQDLHSVYSRTGLLSLACMLIGLAGSVFYARRFVKPIRVLTEATEQVSEGDLSVRARISSGDEIETLGASFDTMTETLEKAYDELSSAQDFTSKIIESLKEMLIVSSPEGTVIKINSAACDQLGYEEIELLGQPMSVIFEDHPEASFWTSSGQQRNLEENLRSKAGEQIPVLLSYSPMITESGKAEGIVFAALDMREKKRAEAARLKREERLRNQKDALAVLARDKPLHAGDFDRAARRLVEVVAATLTVARSNLWLFNQDNSSIECVTAFDAASEDHSSGSRIQVKQNPAYFAALQDERTLDAHDARNDPRTRAFASSYLEPHEIMSTLDAPIQLQGELVGVLRCEHVGPMRIWTLEEQSFVGSVADLASLALEARNRRVAQEQLAEAKEIAEAASRSKSLFLANMSHEIRTPMNGVSGMLKLMENTALDKKQRRYVDLASSSAEALLRVINDILDFSKVEAGKLELESIDFDLWKTIDTIANPFIKKAEEKGLRVFTHFCSDVPRLVKGDPTRLQQVIMNLLSNAVKFTDEGEISIKVSLEAETDQHQVIRFVINDSGIGISQEQLNSLFDSFTQADSSTTRTHGGTGLGLSICKQLINLMGGEIGAVSGLGTGTEFWFTVSFNFPYSQDEEPSSSSHLLRGVRVLVADENSSSRLAVLEQAKAWGCSVTGVHDCETAADRLLQEAREGSPFHLAVLDSSILGPNGVGTNLILQQAEELSSTRIIVVDSADSSSLPELVAKGIAGYLPHPVTPSSLHDVIVCAIQDSSKSHEPEDSNSSRSPNGTSGAQILLADDNPVNQELVKVTLENRGHECVCVADGLEAVKALESGDFDLVLMDCQMPRMDGFEATKRIRSLEDGSAAGVPIIALTASDLREDQKRCMASGMDDFLTKPIDSKLLIATLEKRLAQSGFRSDAVKRTNQIAQELEVSEERMVHESPISGCRILVAEDNAVNQELTREMLLILGGRVHIAKNGHEVIEALSNDSFDLILMDCQMPEMDGYQATQMIREKESDAEDQTHIPIVALTAHAMTGDRRRCLDAGMDDYLSKPVSLSDLTTALCRWIDVEGKYPQNDPLTDEVKPGQSEDNGSNGAGIDQKALDQIRQLDPDGSAGIMQKVLKIYLDESSELVSRIEQAIGEGDPEGLRQAAHSLKSSSAQVGAMKLAELSKEIEDIGRKEAIDGAIELYPQTEREYDEVRKALSMELKRSKGQVDGRSR